MFLYVFVEFFDFTNCSLRVPFISSLSDDGLAMLCRKRKNTGMPVAPQTPGNGQSKSRGHELPCLCGRRKAAAEVAMQDRLLFPTGTEPNIATVRAQS